MRAVCAALVTSALAACATPPARVDSPHTVGPDKSYTVDLPVGWIQMSTPETVLMASYDGYPLQTIMLVKRPLKAAFARTKKDASAALLPSELAEMQIAELKATSEQLAALQVLENEPALLSGRDGYRLKVAYKTSRGLDIQRVVYGVVDASGYYRLEYIAPALYYYDKYFPQFEKVVASFQLGSAERRTSPPNGNPFGFVRT